MRSTSNAFIIQTLQNKDPMEYTVKELYKLSNKNICQRQIRRRCVKLQPQYPNLIKRTSNRMWLVDSQIANEVIKRKNNRIMDSILINLGKQNKFKGYNVLKETLDEIRQEFDTIEWKFFTGFRPLNRHDTHYLFNFIKTIADELERKTKSNISIFYAIEKDDKQLYHVHMTISGTDEVKSVYMKLFNFKFRELNFKPMIPEIFNNQYQSECYDYFSKEYFIDDNMRIGIIKQ